MPRINPVIERVKKVLLSISKISSIESASIITAADIIIHNAGILTLSSLWIKGYNITPNKNEK